MLHQTWVAKRIAQSLAAELLGGVWNRRGLLRRARGLLGGKAAKAQSRLVSEVLAASTSPYPPSPEQLAEILLGSENFEAASASAAKAWINLPVIPKPPLFAPTPRFAGLDIPRLVTVGDLATWLEITPAQLDWFADERRQQVRAVEPALQHYTYAFVAKSAGPPRLVEAPKARLKAMQRRVLRDILDKVPVHPCAYGFVAGRSCIDAAAIHAGEAAIIAADLKEFFPSTPMRRVHGLLRSLGYPHAIARALTGLCATATPEGVFLRLPVDQRHDWFTRRLYRTPHLAQGAPTSPALANLAAFGLDARLAGLADAVGARYTRFADDLAFSGEDDLARRSDAFLAVVEAIARDEGYRLNVRKSRIMRRGGCQRLTGIVVNSHANVPRAEFDALKAILHNCRRNGPAAENRAGHPDFRAHLDGRVGWVEQVNPTRGQRLREMYAAIAWPGA